MAVLLHSKLGQSCDQCWPSVLRGRATHATVPHAASNVLCSVVSYSLCAEREVSQLPIRAVRISIQIPERHMTLLLK